MTAFIKRHWARTLALQIWILEAPFELHFWTWAFVLHMPLSLSLLWSNLWFFYMICEKKTNYVCRTMEYLVFSNMVILYIFYTEILMQKRMICSLFESEPKHRMSIFQMRWKITKIWYLIFHRIWTIKLFCSLVISSKSKQVWPIFAHFFVWELKRNYSWFFGS